MHETTVPKTRLALPQVRMMVYDIMKLTMGECDTIDSIQASNVIRRRWGFAIDWHETSIALDSLHRGGAIILAGIGGTGMCSYRLKRAGDDADE